MSDINKLFPLFSLIQRNLRPLKPKTSGLNISIYKTTSLMIHDYVMMRIATTIIKHTQSVHIVNHYGKAKASEIIEPAIFFTLT